MLEGHVGHRERFSKQTEDDDGGEEDFLAVFNSARPAGPAWLLLPAPLQVDCPA